jgi:di/tricarboxylate transporter
MSVEIIILFAILITAILFFITEWLRVDLVALLVLSALVLSNLITPEQALSGFSSPAVVTVWAIFILSGALERTGVASQLGTVITRLAGESEVRLIVVIMTLAGLLSAFMNNTGVAALLLPVVLDMSRQLHISPAKLLIPLMASALLGGMTTLISTPTNILVSSALGDAGFSQLALFDFTPVGLLLLLTGIIFMVLIGRFLLPDRRVEDVLTGGRSATQQFALEERVGVIQIPVNSPLVGKTLAESYIGRFLDITILTIQRTDGTQVSADVNQELQAWDRLFVLGKLKRLEAIRQTPPLVVARNVTAVEMLSKAGIELTEVQLSEHSKLVGKTLVEGNVRGRFGVNVLMLRRGNLLRHTRIQKLQLQSDDRLLIAGKPEQIAQLTAQPGIERLSVAQDWEQLLADRLLTLLVTGSFAEGTLADARLGKTFGVVALALQRGDEVLPMPSGDLALEVDDVLVVEGPPHGLDILQGLQTLLVEPYPEVDSVEIEQILDSPTSGLIQAVLSPYTRLQGKTLREINFREKYGLSVLAIWRSGEPKRSNLGDLPLAFGDALLLHGPRSQFPILGHDPDFLVLQADAQEPPRQSKALMATGLMIAVVAVAIAGWLPIALAALIGASLVVLTGCLDMDEAYRYIEWKAVFLIACMLPLGIAMEQTGAAQLVAETVAGTLGALGPHILLAGMFLLGLAATQFMPNPVVAVLMAPIAISSAVDAGLSPYPFALAIAFASSAAFLTPVGHAANVLVMGPGGYRFMDYVKVGFPLALLLLLVVVFVLPLFWPF